MKDFRRFNVWQKGHKLVLKIYQETKNFPQEEKYGLVQQMRRCAVSVVANIVEGSKRRTDKDFCHFLHMSQGSLEELKYYLILGRDLNFMLDDVQECFFRDCEEVGKLLYCFIRKLQS